MATTNAPPQLGRTYRDTISGFEGVATGVFFYLHGCQRVHLEGSVNGEPKGFTFDEPQLEEVEAPSVSSTLGRGGGPRPEPSRTGH